MSGTTLSSQGLDPRRKRILFRSWHRGTREMDLLLGRFADAELPHMSDADLDVFEVLMEVPDQDLFSWITGKARTPDNYDSAVFRKVVRFHMDRSDPAT
ncbi:MAG: succinate dehydrogenase assembly factor 2 [Pseudomonadota bacterium]